MKVKRILFEELDYFFSNYFKNRKYFVCIYGSYANGHYNKDSDVDLFIASGNFSNLDLESIREFVTDFHKKHNLSLDNEVPYEVKLLIKYKELTDAVNLKGFKSCKNGTIIIPKVEKNKDFLESYEVKLRLALNALTSPHIMFGNDRKTYEQIKSKAENAICRLAINLAGGNTSITKSRLLSVLLGGQHNEEGELYLGYKNYNTVASYLSELLERNKKIYDKQ